MQEHEKTGYRETFLEWARNEAHAQLQELMRTIVYKHVREPSGPRDIYELFADIFNELFPDLIIKKIDLKRKTRHMLEMLSLPHHRKPYDQQMKIYEDIVENRTYYQRKKKPETVDESKNNANS